MIHSCVESTKRCPDLTHLQAGQRKALTYMQNMRNAQVVELADTGDLKSPGQMRLCGFESRPGHFRFFKITPVPG